MAFQGVPLGRASRVAIRPQSGQPAVLIDGLADFLRDASRADDRFNTEMRKAAQGVAEQIVDGAKMEAATVTRNRQALEVMKGMRAQRDRVPTVKLSDKSGFVSQSRPNRSRKRKVTRGDVFFGAEFGGQARRTTDQFLRHRGRSGYFFWPTVRKLKNKIAEDYLAAIDRVLRTLAK
jgi:hypothetical protein